MTRREMPPEERAALVAEMAADAALLTDADFAHRIVGLLIRDEGHLNRYLWTIELMLEVFREREKLIVARETGASVPSMDLSEASRAWVAGHGYDPDGDEPTLVAASARLAYVAGANWAQGYATEEAINSYERGLTQHFNGTLLPSRVLGEAFVAGAQYVRSQRGENV